MSTRPCRWIASCAWLTALCVLLPHAASATGDDAASAIDIPIAAAPSERVDIALDDTSRGETGPAPVDASPAQHDGALALLFENDTFFDTDRDYTSGEEIAYTTADDETPQALVAFAQALPFLLGSRDVRASYEIGQDIFTPAHTHLAIPLATEQPYAGFLYAGLGILARDGSRFDQLQIQLGTIGPAALAQDAQSLVHHALGEATPAGWHFQLRDEPILQFTYERALKIIPPRSLFGLYVDIEPHYGVAVGNAYDYVNAGAMLRLGVDLPDDFGPLRMQPSLPGSNYFEPTADFSAYVFAGLDGRAIARNIFLDGNSFAASRRVDKIPFVADFQLGAAIATDSWRLSFTHVFRTKEYRTQPSSDQFGAVNLTLRT